MEKAAQVLGLLVYVFGGAIQTGTDNYVNYLLAGILLITIASGVAYTAYRLFMDMQSGLMFASIKWIVCMLGRRAKARKENDCSSFAIRTIVVILVRIGV